MGFRAKIVFFEKSLAAADKVSGEGKAQCTIWRDMNYDLDFRHITRLEKVASPHYSHIVHSSFRRAGICMIDAIFNILDCNFAEGISKRLAPTILRKPGFPVFDEETGMRCPGPEPMLTIAGNEYVDCWPERLKNTFGGGDERVAQHNEVVRMSKEEKIDFFSRWNLMDPPFLWIGTHDLAGVIRTMEGNSTEGWEAVQKDPLSLALIRSWGFQFEELGRQNVHALFVFS